MAILMTGLAGLFGGGTAAATTAGTVAGGVAAGSAPAVAASGISLGSILQGTATVLGIVSTIAGANAQADQLNMAADDADAEQDLETLQGIQRRSSIKREMADALGAQDVAYAASGVDLSFGTAANARKDAFREADLALTSDTGTEMTRKSRLAERAANYRSQAKTAKRMGLMSGLMSGIDLFQSIKARGA